MACRKLLVLLFICCCIAADDPAADPTTEPSPKDHYWSFTDYLKGTPDEIHAILVKQVEEIIQRRNSILSKLKLNTTKADIDLQDAKQALAAAQTECSVDLQQDRAYQQAMADQASAKQRLDDARHSSASQELLDASTAYARATEAVTDRKQAFMSHYTALTDAQAALQRVQNQTKQDIVPLQTELARAERALGEAESWRRELVDGMDFSCRMKIPMAPGDHGTIGAATIIQIDPDNSAIVECFLPEIVKESNVAKEGLYDTRYRIHKSTIRINGIDLTSHQAGDSLVLDGPFRVESSTQNDDGDIFARVKRYDSDLTLLMAAIHQPPAGISADDLDKCVKLSQVKESPKSWLSVNAIAGTIPANLKHGEPAKLADLLNQIKGDLLSTAVTYEDMDVDVNGRPIIFAATPPATKDNIITLHCDATTEQRIVRLGKNRGSTGDAVPIRITGTVTSINMREDGSLSVELSDVRLNP